MNTHFRMQTLVGCTVLLAVSQSAAFAKGPGSGHSAAKYSAGNSRNFSANAVRSSNVVKTQVMKSQITTQPSSSVTGVKIVNMKNLPSRTTTGVVKKFPGNKVANPSTILLPPKVVTNPPSGGSKFPGGIFDPPIRVTDPPLGGGPKTPPMGGGTGNPPSGGNNPPTGGGTMPPSKDCHPHKCFPNWLWYTPALYSNWGLGYGGGYNGYCASPMFVNNVASAPVLIDSTPAAPVITAAAASDKLTLKLGQSYTIANDNFGEAAGNLALQVNGLTLPVRVDKWDAQQVSFTLPVVGMAQASEGLFQIMKVDQSLNKSVPVMVVAAQ